MRVPRKTKKWHKKRGWTLHFTADGLAYWTRGYAIPFRARGPGRGVFRQG